MGDVSGESEAFAAALEKAQRGDEWGAETTLAQALETAKREQGPASAEYARACYEYGSLLAACGQVRRALEPFRDACAVRVAEPSAIKNRLTYLVQFGELLERVGELDESEKMLRESLAGRAGFYGEDHAGYGFGLEPLAAVLLRKGRLDEALARIDQAVRIFVAAGHERVAGAIGLRAEVVKTRDPSAPAFPQIDAPESFFLTVADAVLSRDPADAAARRAVLREMVELLREKVRDDHPTTLQALSAIANHEQSLGKSGDAEQRCWATRELASAFTRLGDEGQAVVCLLGLALAHSDANQLDEALAVYDEARQRAKALDDPALRAKTLRNMGLLLAQMDRRAEAEKKLRASAKLAGNAGDAEEMGASRVALGIFLQHAGALDEARTLLQQAVDSMDPADPDTLCAQSHLKAIESSGSCGCGDMSESIAESLQRMVEAELPEGLLDRLEVDLTGDDVNIGVHLLREPTPDELERLQSAVHRANAVLRARIKHGGRVAVG
jgi:tetratricopeptide (TPR) repeat protein